MHPSVLTDQNPPNPPNQSEQRASPGLCSDRTTDLQGSHNPSRSLFLVRSNPRQPGLLLSPPGPPETRAILRGGDFGLKILMVCDAHLGVYSWFFYKEKNTLTVPKRKKKSKIIMLTIQKATFYDICILYLSVAIIDTRLI